MENIIKTKLQSIREEQQLSIVFVASLLKISESEYKSIEKNGYNKCNNFQKSQLKKLFGVESSDLIDKENTLYINHPDDLSEKDRNAINQLLNIQKAQNL